MTFTVRRFPGRIRPAALVLMAGLIATAGCRAKNPAAPDVTLYANDLVVGTGATLAAGQTFTVNYTGWIYDVNQPDHKGTQFTTTTGSGPQQFLLLQGQLIEGWYLGLPGMNVGGTRRLEIPPELAYGVTGVSGTIPSNATLVFDIELLSIP